jgi:hypothetical protein
LVVGSYFQPDVYRFKDRTTYHQYFENRYIFGSLTDNLVISLSLIGWFYLSFKDSRIKWPITLFLGAITIFSLATSNSSIIEVLSVVSIPLVISSLLLNKKIDRKLLHLDSSLIATNYFYIFFLFLAVYSVLLSLSNPKADTPFIDIMTLLSRFAPVLMFVLIFTAFFRLVLNKDDLRPSRKPMSSFLFITKTFAIRESDTISRPLCVILLSAIMVLSIFIVMIPHLDGQFNKVGEDTTVYVDWIEEMKDSRNTGELLNFLFIKTGDRPLSLLVLHSILTIFSNNPVIAFEIFLPGILAPLLVLSTYLLTKEITRNTMASLFTSFITAVSFQIMIGVYAGFYANWMALILGYFSICFAIRFLNREHKGDIIGFTISIVALLFIHSYTWTIITTFLIIFLLVLRWRKFYESRPIRTILIIIASVIAIDVAKGILLDTFSAVTRNVLIAEKYGGGLLNLGARWTVLVRTVEVFLAGIYGNIIILILAIYCAIMLKFNNLAGYFTMIFLSIGILPLFFGDKIVQSRVFYDIPFQIPAGFALTSIFMSKKGKFKSIVIGTSLLAIAIYTMNNLGISPR